MDYLCLVLLRNRKCYPIPESIRFIKNSVWRVVLRDVANNNEFTNLEHLLIIHI